ncbi:class I SAM-dependent methyltransferase [Leptospira gomenensis]|uniref:Class I SAM-dependent methyltransferase n=1 Tax=Leptospira gomenensis TaxID=2484974 RepID=A0A5F1YFD4_9LEPT|nr:class I SAM-dependent methyltransferase [Leptospira gomenensis]TGK38602.1 class I SAM-dependent methyltransferase [Leptospira gomenensis]TGK42839.1 class I SAM-dependent methyltransferase [Leptospira gomenensis]TGK49616.1 class I SAM-dependent methyltransferase [Leptospira gomenensis]TGK60714.1 class I SAM-dependent methyltransferase [Leptospira gomenensis]
MLKKKPYTGFSTVYDAIMREVEYDRWSEFILSSYSVHASRFLPQTILDLGCGTCKLWEKFPSSLSFVGIDSSEEMLKIARKKPLSGEWIHSDILHFSLPGRKFDLIVSTHDTLNYLKTEAQLRTLFRKVRDHAQPNGLFFFDLSSLYNFKSQFDGRTFFETAGGFKIRWENRYREDSEILETVLTFSEKKTGQEFSEVHEHRYFSEDTIRSSLLESGWELIDRGSDYKKWAFDESASLINYIAGIRK